MEGGRQISDSERRWRLARRHLLIADTRVASVAAIAEALVALHSSDPATVYLSCWARLTAPSREAVDDALYETPSVLRHHAMRRTLWVFTPVVAGLAHAACTEALALQEWKRLARFLQESEVTPDGAAWVESARVQALAALEGVQDVTARQFGDLVPLLRVPLRLAQGKPYAATQNAHT